MVANKPRLYVTLFAHGASTTTYHWALTLSPKIEDEESHTESTRYHVKNEVNTHGAVIWKYEKKFIGSTRTLQVLARILVDKIEPRDVQKLGAVFENVPLVQDDPNWTCRIWVRDALNALVEAGLGKYFKQSTWDDVENTSRWYVQKKKDEGRYRREYSGDRSTIPTYDYILSRETQM